MERFKVRFYRHFSDVTSPSYPFPKLHKNGHSVFNVCFISIGDTSFNLAVATGGGTVAAFEMGSPVEFLRYNLR